MWSKTKSSKTKTFSCQARKAQMARQVTLRVYLNSRKIKVWRSWTVSSSKTYRAMKMRRLNLSYSERKNHYLFRCENVVRPSKCMKYSKRKPSGVNFTEYMACVCSYLVVTSSLFPCTTLFARHLASHWVSTRRTTVQILRKWTSSASGACASWAMQRMKFPGSSNLRRLNSPSMPVRQLLLSTKFTIAQTSLLLALQSTRFSLRSVLYISTKFSVSASRISSCTRMSQSICQCSFT